MAWDGNRFSALPGTAQAAVSIPRALHAADLGQGPALYIGSDAGLARFNGLATTASLGGKFIANPNRSVQLNAITDFDDGRGRAIYAAGDFQGIARQATQKVAKMTASQDTSTTRIVVGSVSSFCRNNNQRVANPSPASRIHEIKDNKEGRKAGIDHPNFSWFPAFLMEFVFSYESKER